MDPNWHQATNNEPKALENNNKWTLTTLPPGKRLIGAKWVYKVKYNSDDNLERYKVRFIAEGTHNSKA